MRAPRPPRVAPPQRYCITVPLAFVVSDSCAGSARKEQPPGSKSRWCVASICHWFEQPARGCSADSCGSRALCSKCENVDPDLWRENLDWLGRLLNLTEGSSFSVFRLRVLRQYPSFSYSSPPAFSHPPPAHSQPITTVSLNRSLIPRFPHTHGRPLASLNCFTS